MTIKIALLKSGETLVTDIKEAYTEEKLVTYILENPCTIRVNSTHKITEDGQDPIEKVNISLYSWPNFSADKSVALPVDWLITAVEPVESIKEIYKNKFLKENDQTIITPEQSNSDISD